MSIYGGSGQGHPVRVKHDAKCIVVKIRGSNKRKLSQKRKLSKKT